MAAEVGLRRAGLRLPRRGRAGRPRRPQPQHRATGCTSRRSRGLDRAAWPGSAACATTTARCHLRAAAAGGPDAAEPSGCCLARPARDGVGRSREATYELSGGGPLELTHHGESFVLEGARRSTLPVPPAPGPRASRRSRPAGRRGGATAAPRASRPAGRQQHAVAVPALDLAAVGELEARVDALAVQLALHARGPRAAVDLRCTRCPAGTGRELIARSARPGRGRRSRRLRRVRAHSIRRRSAGPVRAPSGADGRRVRSARRGGRRAPEARRRRSPQRCERRRARRAGDGCRPEARHAPRSYAKGAARVATQRPMPPKRTAGRLRLQRQVEHLVDRHHRVEGHRVADLLRHVVEVAAVALGQDHVGEPGRVGGQHLLLEPADRQHAALQRHLAGHADGVAHRAPDSSDASAVVIVMPALGPSLGIAPAGTCTWNSRSSKRSSSMPSSPAWPRT